MNDMDDGRKTLLCFSFRVVLIVHSVLRKNYFCEVESKLVVVSRKLCNTAWSPRRCKRVFDLAVFVGEHVGIRQTRESVLPPFR